LHTVGDDMSDGLLAAIAVIVYVIVVCAPASQILKRTGHSRLWAFAVLLPGFNLIGYWAFAFSKWPIDELIKPKPAPKLDDRIEPSLGQ